MADQGNLNVSEQHIKVVENASSVEVSPEEQQIQIIKQGDDALDLVAIPAAEIDLELRTAKTLLTVADSRPDAYFAYEQATPSDLWIINHPLRKYPSVSVTDSAGSLVEGSVYYASKSHIQISFAAPFGGTAYLN